ncbi:MAG: zinc-binding dehydrogenase, partial [Woeseiaceae bacterium]|nr:zinc-binding dehydrogenase [Woeseiaceae bacterium]
ETGDPDVLRWEQVDVPAPGVGEVLVRNTAIGVGLKETGERKGIYPCPPLPAIPGITAAAEVLDTGPEVTDLNPGDRVAYAGLPPGSYCEQRVMPAERLVRLPDDIDDATAAAIFHKGMTARFLVRKTYAINAGETVLVHAAAGGVGLLLCQWAKHLGATVIGTVSTDAKAKVAAANGCDYPIVYSRDDFVEAVRDVTGGVGVPVVYDSVGKDTFSKSLECLQPLGLMVLYGIASGHPPPLELMKFDIWKSYFYTRPSFYVHTKTREDLLDSAGDLFEVVLSGAVKATISEQYPLKDAAEAHRAIESRRTTGSVILIP